MTQTAASSPSARSRTRRRRNRALRKTVRHRTNSLLVALVVLALFGAIQMLLLIGPPPWPRIDALWIHAHRGQVRLLMFNLALALAASAVITMPRIGHPRARMATLAAWGCAGFVVVQWLWPTAVIVTRVVFNHMI